MLSGIQCVADFFDRQKWPYEIDEEEGDVLESTFSEDHGTYDCRAYVDDENEVFEFYAQMPANVPKKQRAAVAELITRINVGLKLGAFQMDFSDGEVRFHTYVRYLDGKIPDAILEHAVSWNIVMMDMFHPAIMEVAFGRRTPARALAEIEATMQAEQAEPTEPTEPDEA